MSDRTWVVHFRGVPLLLTTDEYEQVRALAFDDPSACQAMLWEIAARDTPRSISDE